MTSQDLELIELVSKEVLAMSEAERATKVFLNQEGIYEEKEDLGTNQD